MSYQNNFYTFQELKDFTNDFTDLNIINITAFIETKTRSKYTVVKRKMIIDLKEQFFQNDIAIIKIHGFLNDQWDRTKEDESTKQIAKDINNFL